MKILMLIPGLAAVVISLFMLAMLLLAVTQPKQLLLQFEGKNDNVVHSFGFVSDTLAP